MSANLPACPLLLGVWFPFLWSSLCHHRPVILLKVYPMSRGVPIIILYIHTLWVTNNKVRNLQKDVTRLLWLLLIMKIRYMHAHAHNYCPPAVNIVDKHSGSLACGYLSKYCNRIAQSFNFLVSQIPPKCNFHGPMQDFLFKWIGVSGCMTLLC